MPQVIFIRGLSGSGKSTLAKQMTDRGYVRANMDDIRSSLGLAFSKDSEKLALEIQDQIVLRALRSGRDVVVDNTHLHNTWPRRIATLIWEAGIEVDYAVVDLTMISEETCLERNEERRERGERSVPSTVIANQSKSLDKYLRNGLWKVEDITNHLPKIEPYKAPIAQQAIIVDIDGTLANATSRGPYDFDRCDEDEVWHHVRDIVWKYDGKAAVILMSGRDSRRRGITSEWLDKHNILYDELFMREHNDTRRDSIVKLELFNEHVRNSYNVMFAIDDRLRVAQMWRNLGIPVLRVGDPDGEF